MLRIPVIALFCLSFSPSRSQQVKAIAIGDDFPAIPPAAALNHSDSSINLSDYKDKLLILDFWATWCTACIRTFPKMDSLQQDFIKDIKIVLINISDSSDKINSFLVRYKQRRGVSLGLPTIWRDPNLLTLLPRTSIPHYAWVHKGRLIATTGPDEITASNISAILRNSIVRFRMKKDILDYDGNRPLLENGNGGDSAAFSFKTFFARELPGMDNGYFEKKTGLHRRQAYINFSISELFSIISGIPPYAILLDIPDAAVHLGPGRPLFSYEITGPVDTPDPVMTALSLQDLNRYLNVSSIIRNQKIPVYRLVMLAKRRKAKYDTAQASFVYNDDNTVLQFNRKQIRFLVSHLNFGPTEYPARAPFVDETGYKGTITVAIPAEARTNVTLLRQILAKEGIRVKKGKKKMKVCIIKDSRSH